MNFASCHFGLPLFAMNYTNNSTTTLDGREVYLCALVTSSSLQPARKTGRLRQKDRKTANMSLDCKIEKKA